MFQCCSFPKKKMFQCYTHFTTQNQLLIWHLPCSCSLAIRILPEQAALIGACIFKHVQYEVPKQNLYIRSAQLMHESGAQRSDWQFIEYHGCLFTKETMDKLHRGISVWHRLQVGLTYWGKHLPHARAGKHEVNASCRLARPVWLHQLKILRISLFRNKVLIFFAVVWSWYLVRETSGRRNGSLTGGALNVLRSLAKERMKSGILKRSMGIDWDSRVGYMSISNIRHIGSWSHRCHADFDLPKTAMPRLLL